MSLPSEVKDLIVRFDAQIDAYKSGAYNETQLRRDFLDPFFGALGWDVSNRQGYAEAYREVIHEDQIRVGATLKAPDYAFRIGGQRKFFVEAKKPSVNIKADATPAYQLRRYAWSAKLPLSLLTDFDEFAVYDCRAKPSPSDHASQSRVFYCTYGELAQHWTFFADTFSRDAVLRGSFDRYAVANKSKRGTAEVDADFLSTIEGWREDLARSLARRNPSLSTRELNFAVQRIIDRIIFLRICEDRGIEDYQSLRHCIEGKGHVYPKLVTLFERADGRYNSGLFHFKQERGRHELPDELTRGLDVDDDLLKGIIKGLYFPDSPYEFGVFGADILGQVYEQFLGKVIRLTGGHLARVEDKPEVKKAGGVYYTPTTIVSYLVRETLRPLLAGKTPRTLKRLRVLDPACGSGSFLLEAYQYLLDWYLEQYLADNPKRWSQGRAPAVVEGRRGWALTTLERKRILIAHIYGIDIDAQAVEVTKLSLLLKVLEGETATSLQRELLTSRVLPDLGDNIKCGNALIGSDYFDQGLLALPDVEEQHRVNVFDWASAHGFATVMTGGGFDAVVGNPPYVRIQTLEKNEVAYLREHYSSAARGNCDLYVSFIERSLALLRKGGGLGMILPNKFLRTDYGEGLRRLLATKKATRRLVDFGAEQVFSATIYTCLLFLQNEAQDAVEYTTSGVSPQALSQLTFRAVPVDQLGSGAWTFQDERSAVIEEKIRRRSVRLLDLPAEMSRGSSTGDDGTFVVGMPNTEIEKELCRIPVFAADFSRYDFSPTQEWGVLFPYRVSAEGTALRESSDLRTHFPRAWAHLTSNQVRLKKRKQFSEWWGFSAPRNLVVHEAAQIAVPLLARTGSCALIPPQWRGKLCPMASGGFTVSVSPDAKVSPEFVLGVLNSTLAFWLLRGISNVFRGGWVTCTKQYFGEIPIPRLNLRDKTQRRQHDVVAALVARRQDLSERRRAARTPAEQQVLDREAASCERQLDTAVFDIFELTPDERDYIIGASAAE